MWDLAPSIKETSKPNMKPFPRLHTYAQTLFSSDSATQDPPPPSPNFLLCTVTFSSIVAGRNMDYRMMLVFQAYQG